MSMTIREVALRLLFRIGVQSLDPNQNANSANATGFDTVNDIAECVTAINGALEECWGLGPTAIREQRPSFQLYPPTSVTLTTTQYSQVISGLSPSPSWMPGCTIRITGDQFDNELISATQLLRPYQGGAGAQSATVFCDAITLDAIIDDVLKPVQIPNIISELVPAANREEFQSSCINFYHHLPRPVQPYYVAQTKVTGQPRMWFAEPRYDPTLGYLPKTLRLNPMPDRAYPLTARVRLKPPTISATDIGTVSSSPPPATLIPQDWNESIILPIAMMRFRSHPAFDLRPAVLAEMQRQYDRAMLLLDALSPQVASTNGRFLT